MSAPDEELPELEDIVDKAIKTHSCGMINGQYMFTECGVRAVLREALLDLYGEIDLLLEDEDMIASNKQGEVIKELAMLVKRLSSTLRIAVPKSRLAENAMAYLKSMQLVGSPMREKE